MKIINFLLLVISFSTAHTQNLAVNTLLNNGLKTEHLLQRSKPANDYKISWQHFYKLKDNLLSIRFTKTDTLTQCSCMIYKQLDITKIKSIAKDIHIVFLTETDAVKEIRTYHNCKTDPTTPRTETDYSDMFITEIKTEQNNENFGKTIQRSLAEKGITINIPYWYD